MVYFRNIERITVTNVKIKHQKNYCYIFKKLNMERITVTKVKINIERITVAYLRKSTDRDRDSFFKT